jgi:mRNA interferase MazF
VTPPLERGAVVWLLVEAPDVAHPQVVLEVGDVDALVCGVTSNVGRAKEPGNVLLDEGEGGLPRQSVIVAAQAQRVLLSRLGARLGRLDERRLVELEAGLRFVAALRR